ncbi:Universal stress protein UspA-like protein [Nostocoides japonicum T1-X7]|uniref:Universal stress protein UspA-like protein n=1 Tax=Nostocoides japonicum T1-X7 TaxID=1194083 RepID=A0A077M863_9MICO|nr:universal stress protein [Tetrasphaera japonica]CCH80200.1 Universal stress protein UspA-like protein [Tetrasphaera japonica T1-X7]
MTVAVALSDTPRGQAALKAAAEEALRRNEGLAVLHIVGGVDEVEANDPAVEKQVSSQLDGIAGLTWKLHTAPERFDTAEALLDEAEEVGATVLVIGSRHRTRVGKLFLGSIVQRVLLESTIPVLVVKAP